MKKIERKLKEKNLDKVGNEKSLRKRSNNVRERKIDR